MTFMLEKKHLEVTPETEKIMMFLNKNAQDVSIVWRMHIIPTEKSKIIPRSSHAIICYNEIDATIGHRSCIQVKKRK